jgi:hypothetical protein
LTCTYPGINGEALATFVTGLWEAVPDFSIELLNDGEIEPGLVAHHWLVKGTSDGKAFSFKGASIIRVEGDKSARMKSILTARRLNKRGTSSLEATSAGRPDPRPTPNEGGP